MTSRDSPASGHFMRTTFCIAQIGMNCLLAYVTLAQGSFRLQNLDPGNGIDAPVFDAEGNRLSGANYAAELWGGAVSNSLSPTLDLQSGLRLSLPFREGLAAGYFGTATVVVWAVPGGASAWVQVRAWDARLGSTYEQVTQLGIGGYGESTVFYTRSGDPTGLPTLPAPLTGLQSFSLLPVVPEPSTWALLALGGLAVGWAVRRWPRGRV
jgi:hypothetical protein